jgi:uncharacterized protein (TIGR03437 family)
MLRLKACFLTVVFLFGVLLFVAGFLFIPCRAFSSSNLARLTVTAEQAVSLNPSLSDDGRVVVFESSANFVDGGLSSSFHGLRAHVAADPVSGNALGEDAAVFEELAGSRMASSALSSDGSVVAFASTEDLVGENADRNSEIFLWTGSGLGQVTHTLPGSSATRLTDGNFQPSITSDGKLVAFTSRGDLVLYNVATGTSTQLTDAETPSNAKLSGDGSRVYYQRGHDLFSLDLKTRTSRVIAADVPGLSIAAGRAVNNDGLRLVYSAESAPNQTQVFLYDARENSTRPLTQLGTRSVDVPLQPSISGDGKRVTFATRRRVTNTSTGSVELYLYDIPSGQTSQITNAPSSATAEVTASLNFDGSLVAFSFPRVLSGPATDNDVGNNNEIYLASLAPRPQFGAATVLNGAALGNEPAPATTVAGGSLATIRGNALAFRTETGISANPPAALAGTTVTVNGHAARIFYASPEEIVFIVPDALPVGPGEFVVTNADGFSAKAQAVITTAAPGIFTRKGDGTGEAIILDSDTQTAGPFDPSNGKLQLSVFATGLAHARNVAATINGQPVRVETIAGSGLPGLDEVHISVPSELRGAGTNTLVITADNIQSNPATLTLDGSALRDITINEILADPPDGLAGDANHDGVRDTTDDEFIELVNSTTRDLDLSNYQLQTRSLTSPTDTLRHRFPPGTILPSSTAIVIFGGGSPNLNKPTLVGFSPETTDPLFGGSQIVNASSGGLSLTNSGAVITLRNSTGEIITSVAYGSTQGLRGDLNQSLTRAPDITGPLTLHSTAPGSDNRNFSPGTKLDGSVFIRVTPTPTPTPTPSSTPTPSPSPSPTPTQSPTPSPSPVATATPIPSPSSSPNATPIPTPTASPTPSPTPTATPTPNNQPKLVISQLFGGGGNANALYRNDFIEILNSGTTPISLSGWSVQYASATASAWSVTPLTSITLQPGQYYLVQEASGGANGANLPTPDATGTIAMAATSGKVALVKSTIPLTGSCPNNENIIDLVGYGSTANCFRGTAPAPAPSNTAAISRNTNGCTDTTNNNTDFKTNPPDPRNIASPVNMCHELAKDDGLDLAKDDALGPAQGDGFEHAKDNSQLTAAFNPIRLFHALSLRRCHITSYALRLRQLPRRPT